MIFKMSLSELFKPLIRLFIIVTLLLLAWASDDGGLLDRRYTLITSLILCVPIIPTIYLLIEYYIAERNKTIEITADSIIVSDNRRHVTYQLNELDYIKLYKSAGMEPGNFPMLTCEMYYHAEVFTVKGEKIILTSISRPGLDKALDLLKDIKLEIKRRIFSTIYL